MAPIAQAIALILAAGGVMGDAHAARAFSPAWFGDKSAIQDTTRTTGVVNGNAAAGLTSPAGQQQQANAQLQQSIANLTLAAHGIAAQQAAQAAARQAAMGNLPNVPDGLGVGGLDAGSLATSWVNANGPTQSTDANGKTVVDIQQTADKAIANWATFNVGKNTIVQFDQQSADWAILNRVNAATAPSQIQGQIRAPGTVLIVNQNGIVFSGSSQVNTRNLVASAANISDSQFTNNGIYGLNGTTPSFTDAGGKLIVEAGAQITTNAATSVTQSGGYVLLMGQQVSNAGDIETPQGQAELAAGDNFIIREGVGTDANTASTTRGNEISPRFDTGSTAGQVANTGLLLAREGDITLAGHDVQQNGVAVATTTVNTRGTIHLLNSASDPTGLVTLGASAVTAVAIEDDGSTTALDSQRATLIADSAAQDIVRAGAGSALFDNLATLTDRRDESRIEIVSGSDVRFEGGSLTLATGGQIAVSAANRLLVDDGAILDVSGDVGVNVAMASNNVLVNVQGNELRDSPANRDSGNLFNNDVWIDRRDLTLVPAGTGGYPTDRWYTPGGLLEVSGYLSNEGHSIGEWAAQGGTIQLDGKEVVTELGSSINLSGGSLNVATGYLAQTWLVGSDGHLYNIDDAPADMTFNGVYKGYEDVHPRWGDTATRYFYNPLIGPRQILENGYTVGRDAGQLIIDAPTSVLEGAIVATVYDGPQQTKARDAVADSYLQAQDAVAKPGTLALGQYGPGGLDGVNDTDIKVGDIADITDGMADESMLPADRINTSWLDASRLNAQGLGEIDLGTQGSVAVDAPLTLANGGVLNIVAPIVDINADVTARGGSISATNILNPAFGAGIGALTINNVAQIDIAAGVALDLRGLWVNELVADGDENGPSGLAYLDGGDVSLASTQSVSLAAASVVDVSSGGAILSNGKTQGGAGGNVRLIANAVVVAADPAANTSGNAALVLDGELRATGVTGGGTLTLAAPSVLIGDGVAATDPDQLVLPSSYFNKGFSNYDITGINGVTVVDGAQIDVVEPVYRLADASRAAPTGAAPSAAMDIWTPPLYLEDPLNDKLTQRAGASLALRTTADGSAGTGTVVIGTGAGIAVDPLQSIVVDSLGQITVDGTLRAPGGKISIINDSPLSLSDGLSIWIGDHAVLDVAGEAYTVVDASGRAYGVANDGGAILLGSDQASVLDSATGTLEASGAFVIVRPGALLDASGAVGTFDATAMLGASAPAGQLTVAGNGGSIALNSLNGIYVDGTMRAPAGGAGAAGGSLSITLETPVYPNSGFGLDNALRAPRTITIDQSAQAPQLPGSLQPGSGDASLQFGQARFGADQIEAGGFDNLSFTARGAILFDGDVTLRAAQSISFFLGGIADTRSDAQVAISAPYVLFGGATPVGAVDEFFPDISGLSAQASTGTLSVAADLIDFQNDVRFGASGSIAQLDGSSVAFDYAGFGDVDFTSQGDIRFLVARLTPSATAAAPTTVTTSGNLSFTAAQLYPATGAVAGVVAGITAAAVQPDSVISINRISDVDPALPDSVFGQLTLAAGTVDQGGIVRAPLGAIVLGATSFGPAGTNGVSEAIRLLPGSITSISADGLTIPYGGTADGTTYTYNGKAVTFAANDIGDFQQILTGVSLVGTAIEVDKGAVVDVSGGGNLTGAGFVSGRGGSVDVLTTALANANPANTFSAPGNQVYAIVPGNASAYAPADTGSGAVPGIGQQITIPAGVPGLAAGTYTLLPARYALLPGAYRVELGKAGGNVLDGAVAAGAGSYLVSGTRGVANTGIRSVLPTQMVLTPGTAVRDDSQYNEMGYSDFARQQAATLSQALPTLPADGGVLAFLYQRAAGDDSTAPALSFQGTALFDAAAGGRAGTALFAFPRFGVGDPEFEIYASQPTPGFAGFSLNAADLNAIGANRLSIGGWESADGFSSSVLDINASANSVTLRQGVTLSAAEVMLVAGSGGLTLEPNVTIDTVGKGAVPFDSTDGIIYSASNPNSNATVIAVSNGNLNFVNTGTPSAAPINIGAGVQLYSEGTISFSTGGEIAIDPTVRFGTRNLGLNVGTINIGDAATMAGAVIPPGLLLSPDFLSQLLAGDTSVGAPALQTLTLSASQSLNVFGSVDLNVVNPATGRADLDLMLNTPAIYGYGSASDSATLTVGTLTWSGIAQLLGSGIPPVYQSMAPAGIVAGGPGTGSGTFNIIADKIVFGYPANNVPNDQVTLDRAMVGFSTVNLEAGEITANNRNTLSVYQAQGAAGGAPGVPGTGGNLNLVTPLLTTEAGATMAYTAGGTLTVAPAAGSTASSATTGALGGEVDLAAASVVLDSTILLPSGKFSVTADGDIALQAGARLGLAGQATQLFDQTLHSFGGDVILASTNGNIAQQAGAVIDVSAASNAAGSVTANADNGSAVFGGQILGGSSDGHPGGTFSITGQSIGDFNALNAMLDAGSVFGARSFDLKQGDLVIGDGVKANTVSVSVDGGSLTVNGTIDASGAAPGTIRLAASNALTLAGTAVLDAHGTVLQTDSYGQPIDAENRGVVELAATHGLLALNAGAAIDVSAPDGVARGEINLDASRTGETSGDINIDASGPLAIKGAQSIAVNGFWTYSPTDAYGTIVQDNGEGADGAPVSASSGFLGMNQVDARSQAFMNAALANGALLGRLSGLRAYTGAFHLRPGVEIDSATPDGTLTVAGDIDLAGFRYASLNPDFQKTGIYGSGEPGALVIRAGGNLDIVGSISDGFGPAPATPDDKDWQLVTGTQANDVETLLPILIGSGSTFPNTAGLSLRYAIPIQASTINGNVAIPVQVTLAGDITVPAGTRLTAPVFDAGGTVVLYPAGTVMAVATTLPAGSQLGAGSVMPGAVGIAAMNWPAGATLGVFAGAVTLSADATVPFEGIIPDGANVLLANGLAPTRPTGSSGTQGPNDVLAPMLPEGDLSWSLRLVSGADLGAADTRIVKPASALKASGISGNLTLSDSHMLTSVSVIQKYLVYYNGSYAGPGYGSVSYGFLCTIAPFTCVQLPDEINVTPGAALPSVVRTGTGDLDMIAGGSFDEQSLYGVYTAGTQSKPLAADGTSNGVTESSNPFNPARQLSFDGSGTVLGFGYGADSPDDNGDGIPDHNYEATLAGYQAWYPTGGGNLLVSAQGDMTGDTAGSGGNGLSSAGGNGQAAAWWINFGTYVSPGIGSPPQLNSFTGFGTLGGGNVAIDVGGNAGVISASSNTTGIDATVASTGRVLADGTLVQTGGGTLNVRIGGALNAFATDNHSGGAFSDLRGDTTITAASVGDIVLAYAHPRLGDPRAPNPLSPGDASPGGGTTPEGGIVVMPGDGTVDVSTRGDLVLAAAESPGGAFTLWTGATAVDLFSAGGNLTPLVPQGSSSGARFFYPASLNMAAASGSIFFVSTNLGFLPLELVPSTRGELNVLAAGSIYGAGAGIEMSGADPSIMSTPFHVATDSNTSPDSYNSLLAFGPDTLTSDAHAGDPDPIRIYAGGDIIDLSLGEVLTFNPIQSPHTPLTWYIGAKAASILAGGDIVNAGVPDIAPIVSPTGSSATTVPGFILNANPNDISTISAGGDILFSSMQVAGPGLLVVEAGGNIYEADKGAFQSVGPVFDVNQANRNSGAGITLMAGVGAAGPDYSDFAKLYFNAADQADAAIPDTDPANAGKVPMTYADQLYAWLQQRFGYGGSEADALNYFLALPNEQQGVFVRQVYFEELDAGGKEFNDPTSKRFQSYLRGRDAIAALFPSADAQGNPISYDGAITLFGNSGIHTDFGGTIQTLTPGGETLVGVEGVNPLGTAGIVTQGSGDIDMYSLGSILLGQSRVMTTFGGDILAWSATGDINAGRGAKTTQVFTPPRRVYDDNGNVTLSPDVPSSGAGFATLAPIPEVPSGDMNLVAPLGTIDAGEAGIRVSGNVNLAALQVVNAANIQVQGKSAGLPVIASVNVGALTNASAAAAQATIAAEDMVRQQQAAARQALPSIFTVTVLGFGADSVGDDKVPPANAPSGPQPAPGAMRYDPKNPVQVVGMGENIDPKQWANLTSDELLRLQQDR